VIEKGKPVTLASIVPPDGDPRSVAFWEWVMTVSPAIAFVLPLAAVWLLGGFVDFQWIDYPVTFFQSFAILGAMMFPFAAFYYARGRWNQARALASEAWPTVPGVIETSNVEQRLTRSGIFYKLALSYRYEVDGNGYDGDTAEFGPPRVTAQDLIEELAQKYPAGAKVTVHYDPDDPASSVLETSDEMARQNQWQIWLFAAVPIGLSIVVAIKNALP
jgi:uncharacterized membrane protein YqaE (UPF0057 family)